jgi:UDP:flavonoid glycosyltransferase YjiC (YdhE family)
MVVYSTRYVDQDGCAARVGFHGLGVVGDKDADGPEEIEANIQRALADVEIRSNVRAMQQRYMEYGERRIAVTHIEHALSG